MVNGPAKKMTLPFCSRYDKWMHLLRMDSWSTWY